MLTTRNGCGAVLSLGCSYALWVPSPCPYAGRLEGLLEYRMEAGMRGTESPFPPLSYLLFFVSKLL